MADKRIVVFGGSFDPPGKHHIEIGRELGKIFDEVYVWPCGRNRPDKRSVGDIEAIHRATMVDLDFFQTSGSGESSKIYVEFYDLENDVFTRTRELDQMMKARYPQAEIWHYVGADLVEGGAHGESKIQREWKDGRNVWRELNFAVGKRSGYSFTKEDLPPHSVVIEMLEYGSSSAIREKVFRDEPYRDFVSTKVADYIERYNLYRGGLPGNSAKFHVKDPSIVAFTDEFRPDLAELVKKRFGFALTDKAPDISVVLGGDGTMFRAVSTWRKRYPYLGINRGHRGYLLNDLRVNYNPRRLLDRELEIVHCPLLRIEIETRDGQKFTQYAFNDAWVEKTNGRSVAVKISIDGRVWIEKLFGDGALVSTPAGSTAYARSMGAPTLPFSANAWILVGNNVDEIIPGNGVKNPSLPKVLRYDSVVELTNADDSVNHFRPLRAFVNDKEFWDVVSLKAQVSRVAAVELLFLPEQHLEEKRMGRRRVR